MPFTRVQDTRRNAINSRIAKANAAGITVEIGGDVTGLDKALKTVNSTIKNTQSQLKDVERLLKLDPSHTELLSQKQALLKDAVGATKEKLDALKTAQEQAKAQMENGDLGVMMSIQKSGTGGDFIIDCERQDIYLRSGRVNKNNDFVLSSGEFFELLPGRNKIECSGLYLNKVWITPNWWTI